MLIGLARTSTLEQVAGLESQIRDLEAMAVSVYSKSKSHL